ncbi:hypothetical protein [Xylophilus sp. GOD-11R]|uniref:hypothetical protein n=1 Tax=Xylophilus sp. GOD-11R TaxID=3089814 RepID=UPI00298D2051|nr:hypothetical protein [Xylophilus sp. GOD-11R]WPB55382.1 hypothetical protein R9X41_14665 [Xylophilus sp. GOD-11R]
MDWVPLVFVTFKLLVLGTGMFFAIKWHYDKGTKWKEARAMLLVSGKVIGIFAVMLIGLLLLTFGIGRMLGLDLTLH